MADNAWVTLATNDSYALGAQVLAHSLKKVNTKYKLAVLVTPGVTECMREKLAQVFDLVHLVDVLDSKDAANLALLERPELGVTFTKLHCWKLVQFKKCVFLDADTLVIQNSDDLFERDEFSAAPDVGWPDCFNSGVFVFKPSVETYDALIKFAKDRGSFDGGDQGLLNTFFENWSTQDSSKRLPFIYNLCSVACYSYLPAFKKYGQNVKIFHFIGNNKPWLQHFDPISCQVQTPAGDPHLGVFLQFWWNIFFDKVHSTLNANMGGLAAAYAQITLGVAPSDAQVAFEEKLRKEAWEAGHVDYLGRDSFDSILQKITETLSLKLEVKPSTPEVPKEDKKGSEITDKNAKVAGEVTTTPTEQIQKVVETLAKVPDVKTDIPSEIKPSEVKEIGQAPKPEEPAVKEEAVSKAPETVACPLTGSSPPAEKVVSTEVPKDAPHCEVGPAVLVEKQPEVGPAVLVKKDKNEKEKAPELGPGVVSTVAICPNLAVAEVYKPPQAAPAEPAKDQDIAPKKDDLCAKADTTAVEPLSGPPKSSEPACALPQVSTTAQAEPAVKSECLVNEPQQEVKPATVEKAAVQAEQPKESTEKSGEKTENKSATEETKPVAEVKDKPQDTKPDEIKTETCPIKQECAKEQIVPVPKPNEEAVQVTPTTETSKAESAKEAAPPKADDVPKPTTPVAECKTECVKEVVAPKTDDAVKPATPTTEQGKPECVKEPTTPKTEVPAKQATPAAEPSKQECVKEAVAPKTVDVDQTIPTTPGIIEATPPQSPLSALVTLPEVPATKSETPADIQKDVSVDVCKKQEANATQQPSGAEISGAPQCPLPSVQNLKIEATIPQTPPACVEKVLEVKAETKSDDKVAAQQDKSAAPIPADTVVPADSCKNENTGKADAVPLVPESPKEALKETPIAENLEPVQKVQPDPENKIVTGESDAKECPKSDDKVTTEIQAGGEPVDVESKTKEAECKDVKEQVPEQSGKSEAEKAVTKPAEKDAKETTCPAKTAAAGAKKKAAAPTKGKSESEKKEGSGESGPVPPPRKKDPKKTTPAPKPTKPTKK